MTRDAPGSVTPTLLLDLSPSDSNRPQSLVSRTRSILRSAPGSDTSPTGLGASTTDYHHTRTSVEETGSMPRGDPGSVTSIAGLGTSTTDHHHHSQVSAVETRSTPRDDPGPITSSPLPGPSVIDHRNQQVIMNSGLTYSPSNMSPAASCASSLRYLSAARSFSPQRPVQWAPRRRHAPPPSLPESRRAKCYADLLPFEVSQLAAVLSHGPPPNTPRDGVVWQTYVAHTNERINMLGPKLRASQALPTLLSWSTKHKLCALHRRLNARPLEDIFDALRYEAEERRIQVWQPVALAGGLSASQTQLLSLIDEMHGLWLTPQEFYRKFGRLPSSRFSYQPDACVGCILARMGGSVEVATALGGLLLGSMRRPGMLSTRVCWCREWIRYTVDGDVDMVESALIEMERVGSRLRDARRWVRERENQAREDRATGLGLGGFYERERTASATLGAQWASHQHKVRDEQIASLEPGEGLSARRATGPASILRRVSGTEGPASLSSSVSEHSEYPQTQDNAGGHHDDRQAQTTNRSREVNAKQTIKPSSTKSTPVAMSPASDYSEFSANPFLDPEAPPIPELPLTPSTRHQPPPDLPFRLFDWHRNDPPDGHTSPMSPQRVAVQWPLDVQSPGQRVTADRFSDNVDSPPSLAMLWPNRGVGALWRRRMLRRERLGRDEMDRRE